MSTAACESAITYLDGDAGILRYRGYPIEQLAENSTYLEVAYLLLNGELPNEAQFATWRHDVTYHTFIHENVRKRFLEGFHYDAHPMGMLVSAVAALSTFYLDAKEHLRSRVPEKQIVRLIAKMPTLAAAAHRFSVGMPFVYPDNSLDFAAELPLHALEGGRATLRGRSRPGPRPRRPVHPPCRPRAELLDDGHAGGRLVTFGSLLGHGRGRRRALRPPARWGQRGRHPDADRHRQHRKRPRLHRHGQGRDRRATAPGLRPPGLQELRPAGEDHQADRLRRVRGHGEEPAARHRPQARGDRAERRVLRLAPPLPECRLLLGPHLPGDGIPARDVHGPLLHPPHHGVAGPLAGDARPGLQDRPARASSTSAPSPATTPRWQSR